MTTPTARYRFSVQFELSEQELQKALLFEIEGMDGDLKESLARDACRQIRTQSTVHCPSTDQKTNSIIWRVVATEKLKGSNANLRAKLAPGSVWVSNSRTRTATISADRGDLVDYLVPDKKGRGRCYTMGVAKFLRAYTWLRKGR